MSKILVVLVAVFFAVPLITGCGQNQAPQAPKAPVVEQDIPSIKPMAPAAEGAIGPEEESEIPAPEAAPKTVTESAIDKAAAIQEAQSVYQAPKEEPVQDVVESAPAPAAIEAPRAEAPKVETPQAEAPKVETLAPVEEVLIANFDSGEKPNNMGGNFGAWNKDPSDPTQWCKETFDNINRRGDAGFGMKLDYSVDSPNPAYNGFWMMLPNFDATKYDALNFWVKGDSKTGYTTVFKIELKNANKQVGRYYVSNVTDQWKEISIPLAEMRTLIDRSVLTEFVVVFEDRMASNKKGVIYIDDIRFIKK